MSAGRRQREVRWSPELAEGGQAASRAQLRKGCRCRQRSAEGVNRPEGPCSPVKAAPMALESKHQSATLWTQAFGGEQELGLTRFSPHIRHFTGAGVPALS